MTNSIFIYSTHFLTIGMNILLYYIWCFMIYVAKIERVTIDKKVLFIYNIKNRKDLSR